MAYVHTLENSKLESEKLARRLGKGWESGFNESSFNECDNYFLYSAVYGPYLRVRYGRFGFVAYISGIPCSAISHTYPTPELALKALSKDIVLSIEEYFKLLPVLNKDI